MTASHETATGHSGCEIARHLRDRIVLQNVSKLVLVTVDSIKSTAEVCPPDLQDHVDSLAYELAGVTVDWVKRWQP